MERCIVAPVDGSSFGEHALPVAATLAKRFGTVLHLVHVHVPLIAPSGAEAVAFGGTWNDLAKQQERSYLDALVRRVAEGYGIRVDSMLVEGPVAAALEQSIQGCGAGLVVMSTHAHTRFRRLWHHGVAEQVARELPIPVLLVHPQKEDQEPDLGTEIPIRQILIPLDGSPYAEAMIGHAVAVGGPLGARYTLLRVVHPEVGSGPAAAGSRQGGEHTAALQYLNAVAERMRARGLDVGARVVASVDPAAAIVDFARTGGGGEPADLIAMQAHPHRPVARIVGAHTADLVLRDSPVPVLLFEPAVGATANSDPGHPMPVTTA